MMGRSRSRSRRIKSRNTSIESGAGARAGNRKSEVERRSRSIIGVFRRHMRAN